MKAANYNCLLADFGKNKAAGRSRTAGQAARNAGKADYRRRAGALALPPRGKNEI